MIHLLLFQSPSSYLNRMASDSPTMDSLPCDFCLDVMGHLNLDKDNYKELSTVLSGRWKEAAETYAHNIEDLELRCKVVNGSWSFVKCFLAPRNDISAEEILAMDDRFIRCNYIFINTCLEDIQYYNPCSKEEILNEVIPRTVQQLRPSSRIFFQHNLCHLSRQDAELFFESFLGSPGFGLRCFGALGLPYYGPESESFLSTLLDRSCSVECLLLDSQWPNSQSVEELLVKFLSPRDGIALYVHPPEDLESETSLTLSSTILEAIVNAWDKADSFLYVCAPWQSGFEEVLLVPVWPNVTRKLLKAKYENKYFIVWSKESGSTLSCTIDFTERKISFDSPPDEKVYDPNNLCFLVSP
uniref:F-box domain-containing protein n=1 Tax=Steinernema glaseri TaxID=37863 RepID=A0A1I7Y6A0_9BILA